MRKIAILTLLCILATAVVATTHYYEVNMFGWTRLLIAAPIVYAGINFRRSGAISISMLLVLAQGPLFVLHYTRYSTFFSDLLIVYVAVCVVSVLFGHVLRKERENSRALEQTHELIRGMRHSIGEEALLSTLEEVFSDRCRSAEVATYMFGADAALRRRGEPGAEPLPPDHLFYTVAASREFLESTDPDQDRRLVWYGPEKESGTASQLAIFPVIYGGRPRGVIYIENTSGERLGKEELALLTAMKQSVENTLDLGEKLRARVQHEIQGKKIRDTFSSYLSRNVAEEILKNPDRVDLGGEVRDVTVMFTEVANFAELMKTVPPAELLGRLNEFFSAAIDTVFEFDGTLDKFIGDNIMAFWGAPLPIPGAERKAVACARELHRKVAGMNADWERAGRETFNVCIGINSGPVVAGNIGSVRRMEYTVIGDTVNSAARIKSLSRSNGIPILIGETTRERIGDAVEIEGKLEAAVKGKAESITVYQIKC